MTEDAVAKLLEAEGVAIFLADVARSQLWTKIQSDDDRYVLLRTANRRLYCFSDLVYRTGMNSSAVGSCFSTSKAVVLDSLPDDPTLEKLQAYLKITQFSPSHTRSDGYVVDVVRCRSVILFPIVKQDQREVHGEIHSEVLGVIVAFNKDAGLSSILLDDTFGNADKSVSHPIDSREPATQGHAIHFLSRFV